MGAPRGGGPGCPCCQKKPMTKGEPEGDPYRALNKFQKEEQSYHKLPAYKDIPEKCPKCNTWNHETQFILELLAERDPIIEWMRYRYKVEDKNELNKWPERLQATCPRCKFNLGIYTCADFNEKY